MDIEKQSEKVQQLYEEYRDLKYIYDHIKVTYLHTNTGSECDAECSCKKPPCGCCDPCNYCDYSWKIGYDGVIPNGEGKKLADTGEASLSTIKNFSKTGSKHVHHDGSCSKHPEKKELENIKSNLSNPNSYINQMNEKWKEYKKAKEEQRAMVKEITACYKWIVEDKLYDTTKPSIYYDYDDYASSEVEGPLLSEEATLTEAKEENCFTHIYNPGCNSTKTFYYDTHHYFADCNEEEDASNEHCYRAKGKNAYHSGLYSDSLFEIGEKINNFGTIYGNKAVSYVKRIERKKWKYKIDPSTKTVYTNKKGSLTHGEDKSSIDQYPSNFTIKLSGFSASPPFTSYVTRIVFGFQCAHKL